jgi:(S)-2-hydroxyglutarate dehydrogenase
VVEGYDTIVVGGGLVGLTTARVLHQRRPDHSVAVLEKEATVAVHQSGHNSGVVHSGVYYRPGSAKARYCLEGRAKLLEYAALEHVPVRGVGKLIVAVEPREESRLDELLARARQNGVDSVQKITGEELRSTLPGVAGRGALRIPSASIIDYSVLAQRLERELSAEGVALLTGNRLLEGALDDSRWNLRTDRQDLRAGFVVNCAGLQADLVARTLGASPPVQIVPFRGDFFRLSPRLQRRVPCLVYPVPDPDLPFLGVHLTPTIAGELLAGPNAAIALAREGYRVGQWEAGELWSMASFRGTSGLARRYGKLAVREWLRSWSPAEFLAAVRTLWPDAERGDLVGRFSGVRAQAVRPDGSLEDDFVFVSAPRALHVLNAPSPAATASFAIAERIADEAGYVVA